MPLKYYSVLLPALVLVAGCAATTQSLGTGNLHRTLLTLDTHLDTPVHFSRAGWSFGDRHTYDNDLAQLDLPRMADGGNLDGGFFAIFTDQGPLTPEGYADARAFALKRSDEIDATIARFPDRIGAARRTMLHMPGGADARQARAHDQDVDMLH